MGQVIPTKLPLPVVVVLGGVHVHGPERAAMAPEVRLPVAVQVEPAQHDPFMDGILEYAGFDGLFVVQDFLRAGDIDRQEPHGGLPLGGWGRGFGRFEGVEDRGVALEDRPQRQRAHDMPCVVDTERDHPLGAGKTVGVVRLPQDLGLPGDLQQVAGLKVDEQEAALRVDHEVAERVEHAVPGVIGKQQRRLVRDDDEPGQAAPVRDVDALPGVVAVVSELAGDEEGVAAGDHRRLRLVQGWPAADGPPFMGGLGRARQIEFAGLDVFRAVAEALHDLDVEPVLADVDDLAVHPVSPARVELEPQAADLRSLNERLVQKIAVDRTCPDPERPRIDGAKKAGRSDQHRRPRPAGGIGSTDKEQGQLSEEGLVLLRHVIADELAPRALHPVRDPEPGLDRLLAPMER